MAASTATAERTSALGPHVTAWRVVLAVSLGASLTSFDAGAITAVLPLIRHAFGRGISEVQWVLSIDLFVASGLLLICGRLGDRFGFRPVYLAGFAVFLGGCMLCAIAPNLSLLIACRALQGIGTAMLLASSPSVLIRHTPVATRGSAFGAKASALYFGLMIGPLLSGWLGGRFGWRAVFVMEAAAALIVFAIAAALTPRELPASESKRFDVGGAWWWAVGMTSFLWLLRARTGPTPFWVPGTALLVVVILVVIRRRHSDAMVRSSCFQNRTFSASVLSLGVAFAASHMLTFALPFLVIEARGEGASVMGRLLALYALSRSCVGWCSGRWSDRIETRLLTLPGLAIFCCVSGLLSATDQSTPIFAVAAALVLAGLGFGCFVPPNNSTLMGSVPHQLQGFAAGVLATARTVGMTIGVTLAGAILSTSAGPLVSRISVALRVAAILALASAIMSAFARSSSRRSEALARSVPTRIGLNDDHPHSGSRAGLLRRQA